MSEMILNRSDDPEMQQAHERARQTFKFFWRELSWENRRIVPALTAAIIKAPFSESPSDDDRVEHMFVNEIDFDGKDVFGELASDPNWVTRVKAGDQVQLPAAQISDWMYAIGDRAYGGFTIHLLRSRMSAAERKEHDQAWGLEFGDPSCVHVVPPEWFAGEQPKGGFFKRLFNRGGPSPPSAAELEATEHPMAGNMADSLREHLSSDPSNLHQTDERGQTILHQMALAGTAIGVQVVLECGGDPSVNANNGMTALDMANHLGWRDVARLLSSRS